MKTIQDSIYDNKMIKSESFKQIDEYVNAMVDNVVKGFSAKVQLSQNVIAELKAKLEKYQIKKAGVSEIQAQLDAMYKQGIQALIRRYRTVQEDLGGGQMQNNVMPQQQ